MNINNPFTPKESGTPEIPVDYGHQVQSTGNCDVMSEKYILHQFGIDMTEGEIMHEALDNGLWADGTTAEDMGKLLENHGIAVERIAGCDMSDIQNELNAHHEIIVALDADQLYSEPGLDSFRHQVLDVFGLHGANHAVTVEGYDAENHVVTIYNPATGCLHGIPEDRFIDCWGGNNGGYMVHTTEPAPNSEYLSLDVDTYKSLDEAFHLHTSDGQSLNPFVDEFSSSNISIQASLDGGNQLSISTDYLDQDVLDVLGNHGQGDSHFELVVHPDGSGEFIDTDNNSTVSIDADGNVTGFDMDDNLVDGSDSIDFDNTDDDNPVDGSDFIDFDSTGDDNIMDDSDVTDTDSTGDDNVMDDSDVTDTDSTGDDNSINDFNHTDVDYD